MILIFCDHCFGWGLRVANRCTECGCVLDLSKPDPLVSDVEMIVGQFEKILGRAIVERKILPRKGSLIETSRGLLFLPELEKQGHSFVVSKNSDKQWFQPVKQIWDSLRSPRSPLSEEGKSESQIAISEEKFIQGESLAEQLLSLPGAFFVEHDRIVTFRKKNQYWTLERLYGKLIQMKIDESTATEG